eukprot:UN17446
MWTDIKKNLSDTTAMEFENRESQNPNRDDRLIT